MIRAALVLVAVAGCSRAPAEPAPPRAPASAATAWVRVRPARDVSLLEMPAQVLAAPGSRAVVTPPFSGRVTRIVAAPGQRVARGAALVEVVMPELVQAAGAHAAATTRIAAYERRREQLEALRREGLTRTIDLNETETKLAEARADQKTALATLRAAGVSPTDAARLLNASGSAIALRSPIAGVVTAVDATVGETREGGGAPLVRVAGESATRVEARLSHTLPAGARFELMLPSREAAPLRLVEQSPVVDPRDGTRSAWFSTEKPLPAGSPGRLRILLPEAAGALVVPAAAVGGEPGRAFVWKREGDAPRRAQVTLLARSGSDALVSGDLTVGDEVAADAQAVAPDAGPT